MEFIDFSVFTPESAAIGGAIIGLSATIMLLGNGKIAGISGILGGLLQTGTGRTNHALFIAGLLVGGTLLRWFYPEAFDFSGGRDTPMLIGAGLLVGFGTRMGSGCTSGHGVCGLSRLSKRSLVATLTFMAIGFATASGIAILGGLS